MDMGMPSKEKVLLAWMAPVALVALAGQSAASLAREAEQIRADGLPELLGVDHWLTLLAAGFATVVVRVCLRRIWLFRDRRGGWLTLVATTAFLQLVSAGLCAVLGAAGAPPVLSTVLVVMASVLPGGTLVLITTPMFVRFDGTLEGAQATRPESSSTPAGGQTPTSRPVTAPMSEGEAARRILGLSAGASMAEVRSAYRRLVKIHHPDKGGAAENFQQIQRAYERLARV